MDPALSLDGGEEIVETWSGEATQAERNTVYEALFALADGSALQRYDVRATEGRYSLEVEECEVTVHGRIDPDSFSVDAIESAHTDQDG